MSFGSHFLFLLLASVSSAAFTECTAGLLRLLSNTFTLVPKDEHGAMAALSGKWLNDLGDFNGCSRVPGAEYALLYTNLDGLFVALGLCGPQSCGVEDYQKLFEEPWKTTQPFSALFQRTNITLEAYASHFTAHRLKATPTVKVVFPRELEPTGLSSGAGLMVAVCALLLCCVAAGTLIELLHVPERRRLQPAKDSIELVNMTELSAKSSSSSTDALASRSVSQSVLVRCLLSFSLVSNLPRLFSVSEKERNDPLFALNGIRVVSMLWIILGHVLIFGLMGSPIKNPQDILPFFKTYETTIIYSAHFAVDTFLWLTGLLLTFVLLQKLTNSQQSPSTMQLYLHRFVRILPSYAFVLFLTWTLSIYIVNGPLSFSMNRVSEQCTDYWWTNLLFLNNQIPYGKGGECLGQSWYLAVDMQLYLIGVPIVLLYHHRERKFGWVSVAVLCLLSVVTSGSISIANGFGVSPRTPGNTENNYFHRYYTQPYCRAAPFAIGLLVGFLLHTAKVYKSATQVYDPLAMRVVALYDSPSVRWVSIAVGTGLIFFVMLVQHSALQAIDDQSLLWSQAEDVLFISFARLLWGVGLSLLMLPILLGLSPVCRWPFSWSIWAPLARLSFGAYLLHIHLVFIYRFSAEAAWWFGDLSLYTDFSFLAILTFGLTVLLSLMVEIPAQGLVRVLLQGA